ncbi:MAG TPA: ABC transporter ATP-binding protein [Thermotogota bacterium]|nr:ABC transporter ATP-binding protein [Thermotogota bacterium]HPJ89031.1 ABC transporter ATP-binding protein [Thermotogota bacterium]HPR95542.1 ABC transporter ATP-binding protein [Thermotogota bacterium]
MEKNLLEIRDFSAGYSFNNVKVEAVRNVNLTLKENEFLGIAGESGCGKSTLAFAITRLLEYPGKIFSGEVIFNGMNLMQLSEKELRKKRWELFSVVFQASMDVLNPVKKIEDHFIDTFQAHQSIGLKEIVKQSERLMELVKVSPKYLKAYPFQLSGGMKQRIVIALALALNPKLIIMDEPTTALDVVVQRKIMQEIDLLRKEFGFSIIFITHDLSLLVEISDKLAIMYGGEIVEYAPSIKLYNNPMHPYTNGLMNAFPSLTGKTGRLYGIKGNPPDLSKKIDYCPFWDRCTDNNTGMCEKSVKPHLIEVEKDHFVACNRYKERIV